MGNKSDEILTEAREELSEFTSPKKASKIIYSINRSSKHKNSQSKIKQNSSPNHNLRKSYDSKQARKSQEFLNTTSAVLDTKHLGAATLSSNQVQQLKGASPRDSLISSSIVVS